MIKSVIKKKPRPVAKKSATKNKEILCVDDEPHNIYWISDFLHSEGYSVTIVANLNDAIREISAKNYRALIIDLNIPALEPLDVELRKEGSVFARFPGLYAARYARNKGYRTRQTIIYSVHQDADVREQADKMRCVFLAKGRPKVFMSELVETLSFDPTTDEKK